MVSPQLYNQEILGSSPYFFRYVRLAGGHTYPGFTPGLTEGGAWGVPRKYGHEMIVLGIELYSLSVLQIG